MTYSAKSPLRRLKRDEGLSIIEILAAMLLFGIVTIGVIPLFVSGLRSSLASRFETQAKNLAQERLEVMRNLPFYVASTSIAPIPCADPARSNPLGSGGVPQCDYRDLLDTYFRSAISLAPASSPNPPTAGGYVSANTQRSADEVAAGLAAPYYRYVPVPDASFQGGRFSQVIVSQFLDASRKVVKPGSTYNTQDPAQDTPPSRLIGTTIITRWQVGQPGSSPARKYVTFSQIAEGTLEETSVSISAEATAMVVGSFYEPPAPTLEDPGSRIEAFAGISRSEASVAGATSASTYAQGGYAALVPGSRQDGKYRTASGPPSTSSSGGTADSVTLVPPSDTFNTYARLTSTDATGVSVGTNPGEPSVPADAPGTLTSKGSLRPSGTVAVDFGFDNGDPGPGFFASGMPQPPDYDRPFVWIKSPTSADGATGQTYLSSKKGAGHFAKAGAMASTQEVHIMPTNFAPDGLVVVRLNSARLVCNAPGPPGPATVQAEFDGYIKFFRAAQDGSLPGYVELPFSHTAPPPEAMVAATPVSLGVGDCRDPSNTDCIAPPRTLGQYIKGWSVIQVPPHTLGPNGNAASSALDGIVRVTTQNTRGSVDVAVPKNASAIEVRLGILSCNAEDKRP